MESNDSVDYFVKELRFKFEIKDLTEVEVEMDGKKKKMNKGKVTIEIKGTLIKDPDSKWEISSYYRFWRDVYNKYIFLKELTAWKEQISGDVIGLKEELKAYLELSGRRR